MRFSICDLRFAIAGLVGAVGAIIVAGCIGDPANPAATQPVTVIDLATTQPSYWLVQPAQTVAYGDFETLWNTCADCARDFLFSIDRTDYRAGVLTTHPVTGRLWFEFWRPDIQTSDDLEEATLATVRRTIRFEFTRMPDGSYQVAPKVLVERQTVAEQRITSVVTYRGLFTPPHNKRDIPKGTHESDVGEMLPPRYWYAIGRDEALETALVDSIQKKLRRG